MFLFVYSEYDNKKLQFEHTGKRKWHSNWDNLILTIFVADMQLTGYISQIIGPVVDVHFPELGEGSKLPGIHEAMTAARPDGKGIPSEP